VDRKGKLVPNLQRLTVERSEKREDIKRGRLGRNLRKTACILGAESNNIFPLSNLKRGKGAFKGKAARSKKGGLMRNRSRYLSTLCQLLGYTKKEGLKKKGTFKGTFKPWLATGIAQLNQSGKIIYLFLTIAARR